MTTPLGPLGVKVHHNQTNRLGEKFKMPWVILYLKARRDISKSLYLTRKGWSWCLYRHAVVLFVCSTPRLKLGHPFAGGHLTSPTENFRSGKSNSPVFEARWVDICCVGPSLGGARQQKAEVSSFDSCIGSTTLGSGNTDESKLFAFPPPSTTINRYFPPPAR